MQNRLIISVAFSVLVILSAQSANASSASQSFDDGVNESVIQAKQLTQLIEADTEHESKEGEFKYRVSAVPEPENYLLLLAGLSLLALRKKSRQ
jgi:uncharacterized protein YpmS